MDKKTIGGFISALRKANGLTQRQLAEKLNVSDKAVSRWERDEAMPDLTLIPVLAEIFHVTTDEILRGERRNPDAPAVKAEERTEKQKKRFLTDKKTKYQIRSTVSIGIAVLGLIAAMICNFGFLRAYIGFMVGCIFYAAATVCQIIFVTLHLSGLDEDILTGEALAQYRSDTYRLSAAVFGTILTLIATSLPLVIIPWDPYLGLEVGPWALYGGLYGVICLILCWIMSSILQLSLVKRGHLSMQPRKAALQKLRLQFAGLLALTLAVLLIIQSILNSVLPDLLMQGTELHSWDAFKALMEEPKEADSEIIYGDGVGEIGMHISVKTEPIDVPDESISSDSENIEYHDDGSISIYPDYPNEQIRDEDGKLLCEFVVRNETINGWNYEYNGDELTITVYTAQDRRNVNSIMDNWVNPLYVLLYPISAIILFLLYRKRTKQIS